MHPVLDLFVDSTVILTAGIIWLTQNKQLFFSNFSMLLWNSTSEAILF